MLEAFLNKLAKQPGYGLIIAYQPWLPDTALHWQIMERVVEPGVGAEGAEDWSCAADVGGIWYAPAATFAQALTNYLENNRTNVAGWGATIPEENQDA